MTVKSFIRFTSGVLLFAAVISSAKAAFTNLYVFGDGISTTTNNTSGLPYFYGQRYSNGRVWVEVLAQRQGLTYDSNKNWSYFYNSCTTMLANVTSFTAPANASNALFVIWVNCADLWFLATYAGTDMSQWTNAINQSQTNHYKAATNLYFAKNVRSLIMPNAVDLSTIPAFDNSGNSTFIHLRCLEYNVAFSNTLKRITSSCPNLKLYSPDFYALLNNLLAYPAKYGVTNALCSGFSIDAVDAENCGFPSAATNGFGTNFIFWDPQDPTAMVHDWMANVAQQLISPVYISNITAFNGSNRLTMANVPVGQRGQVLGRTNLVLGSWTTNLNNINTTNTTQAVYVPASGRQWFYRLSFLYSWTWP